MKIRIERLIDSIKKDIEACGFNGADDTTVNALCISLKKLLDLALEYKIEFGTNKYMNIYEQLDPHVTALVIELAEAAIKKYSKKE